jgi:hypothetical protein
MLFALVNVLKPVRWVAGLFLCTRLWHEEGRWDPWLSCQQGLRPEGPLSPAAPTQLGFQPARDPQNLPNVSTIVRLGCLARGSLKPPAASTGYQDRSSLSQPKCQTQAFLKTSFVVFLFDRFLYVSSESSSSLFLSVHDALFPA